MSGLPRLPIMRRSPSLFSCSTAHVAHADALKVGDRLAELDVAVDANGKSFKLKSVSGWRLVTVGASWCKPCAKELPTWDKLAPEFKGKVSFVADQHR